MRSAVAVVEGAVARVGVVVAPAEVDQVGAVVPNAEAVEAVHNEVVPVAVVVPNEVERVEAEAADRRP